MSKDMKSEFSKKTNVSSEPIYKKIMDYGVATPALILTSPLIAYCLIRSVWVHQTINPFYLDERVGKDGKTFRLTKIKSMKDEFDSVTGAQLSEEERTTKFGETIRRLKFDELPQFWDVLRGKISLVGPRPLRAKNQTSQDAFRQSVKPGITGLQQITGGNRLTYEERLMLDHQYARRRNFFLDLGILIATPGAISRQRNDPHFGKDADAEADKTPTTTDDTAPKP